MRRQITEYLDIELQKEMWVCRCCGHELISARENYKKGCLLYDRDPHDIHPPVIDETYTFSADPNWMRYIEFYCPGCGTMIEVEALPPGHPITHDIELDIDRLKEKYLQAKEG
ncbi:acetone carboxylase subunit gamma [Paenibacillus sp. EPM92]|uniref:acetone carboxylase subunit gamma n=1 Tax=Paenibacillus sp. EPM92 TaxID=1561195 RepID=UPI001915B7DF|nr:acetone carboxylase subunit gamma [Paenibacillus sp. EPM92]